MSNRFWRKNKTTVVFGVLFVGALGLSAGDIGNKMQSISEDRQQIAAQDRKQAMLEQGEEYDEAKAKIANARMKRGCILVVDLRTAKNLTTLVEGQPVRDRTTKAYLPAGVTVCGANGETAVIRQNQDGVPVISDIAVGDRELVYKNLKNVRGARVFYSVPETKVNK